MAEIVRPGEELEDAFVRLVGSHTPSYPEILDGD
jgi:hypothetical protein